MIFCEISRYIKTRKCAINAREYRRGNKKKWTIQRNWQHMVNKTKKNKAKTQDTIFGGHHYTQTNTNNMNKTSMCHPTNNWR